MTWSEIILAIVPLAHIALSSQLEVWLITIACFIPGAGLFSYWLLAVDAPFWRLALLGLLQLSFVLIFNLALDSSFGLVQSAFLVPTSLAAMLVLFRPIVPGLTLADFISLFLILLGSQVFLRGIYDNFF